MITYLGGGSRQSRAAAVFLPVREEEEVRMCEGNNVGTPRPVQKEGGDAPGAGAMNPLQAVVSPG